MATIIVNGKEVTKEEFTKLQEEVKNNKAKKLKKISETEYRLLEKLNG